VSKRSIELNVINRSSRPMPKSFLALWIKLLSKEKAFRKCLGREVVVVFVDPDEMKRLNKKFRQKNYATDVLSFASDPSDEAVGELVICPQVISRQAKEHRLLVKEELGYMVLHGLLHLLGHDHERSASAARKMFRLQDEIFERLLRKT
jgi:probable rRNA maturation factor